MDQKQILRKVHRAVADERVNIAQLARAGGCSRQHIYDLFSGRGQMRLETALAWGPLCGYELSVQENIPLNS